MLSLKALKPFFLLSIMLVFGVGAAYGQGNCPAIVTSALDQLDENCSGVDRNSACYGFNLIYSTFSEAVPADFFSKPSDQAQLAQLQTIQTTPLDEDTDTWGIALLNVQANVPNALPGQAVTFLLMGDAVLENRVAPEDMLVAVDPLALTIQTESIVRLAPTEDGEVIGTLSEGTSIQADAVDAEREWLRILYLGAEGWVRRETVGADEAVDTLPSITAESRSPMQAFYFSTGIGEPQCNQAPDVLMIRSPENLEVHLNVNGADIGMGSTVMFKSAADDQVAITVHSGHVDIVDDDMTVNAGETIIGTLDDSQTVTEWETPRPATAEEFASADTPLIVLDVLDGDELPETEAPVSDNGEIIHTVASGETLYSIGQLYDASLPAIVTRNQLGDPRNIFAGQQLFIPNPGSGFENLPDAQTGIPNPVFPVNPPVLPVQPQVPVTGVDCRPFRATSPLQGLAFGENTFYWDAAPGATQYQVIVRNATENRSVTFPTIGTETSVKGVVDYTTVGGGFDFVWEVHALLNGVAVCTSGPFSMQRSISPAAPPIAPPVVSPPPTTISASWVCATSAPGQVTINYSGLPIGESITFTYTVSFSSTTMTFSSGPYTAASGAVSINIGSGNTATGIATTTDSQSAVITPNPISC